MREKRHCKSSQREQRETLTSAENWQARGSTTSLAIVVAPTMTIVCEVGPWINGWSCISYHPHWISFPAPVSCKLLCLLQRYPAASDLCCHPPTMSSTWKYYAWFEDDAEVPVAVNWTAACAVTWSVLQNFRNLSGRNIGRDQGVKGKGPKNHVFVCRRTRRAKVRGIRKIYIQNVEP